MSPVVSASSSIMAAAWRAARRLARVWLRAPNAGSSGSRAMNSRVDLESAARGQRSSTPMRGSCARLESSRRGAAAATPRSWRTRAQVCGGAEARVRGAARTAPGAAVRVRVVGTSRHRPGGARLGLPRRRRVARGSFSTAGGWAISSSSPRTRSSESSKESSSDRGSPFERPGGRWRPMSPAYGGPPSSTKIRPQGPACWSRETVI